MTGDLILRERIPDLHGLGTLCSNGSWMRGLEDIDRSRFANQSMFCILFNFQ